MFLQRYAPFLNMVTTSFDVPRFPKQNLLLLQHKHLHSVADHSRRGNASDAKKFYVQ